MIDWPKKIDSLPTQSGVYVFKGKLNEPLYVGKAVSLKSRLRNYFQDIANLSTRIAAMLELATDVECIITQNELEALVLEQNLIKQFKPKYNVKIKDDKRYPWLRFSYGEDFPRLYVVRMPKQDNHKYFGPFPIGSALRKTLPLLHSIFPIRTCKLNIVEGKKAIDRPCLEYYLHRSPAPCVGYISKSAYRAICDQVCMFLEGRHQEVLKQLEEKMEKLSAEMKFEEAALVRDQIEAVKAVQTKQIMYTPETVERDFIAPHKNFMRGQGELAAVAVFVIRSGKLIGKEKYILEGVQGLSSAELLATFLKQHYQTSYQVPKEIYLPEHPEDEPALIEWLSQIKEQGRFEMEKKSSIRIALVVPERGEKRKLLETVAENAQLYLQEESLRRQPELAKVSAEVIDLKSVLNLPEFPGYIEAFDISNIGGTDAVGSQVVFRNGKPSKSEYRKYRIKLVQGIDDYAMMQEVITRRYIRLLEEQSKVRSPKSEEKPPSLRTVLLPDLILIDGGLGHLHAALDAINNVFSSYGVPFNVPMMGLAKKLEEIYIPSQSEPILLPEDSSALHLLQRIRDEAHRFAITYHRQLRKKHITHSILDDMPGIGEKKKLLLLHYFGSVETLQSVTIAELQLVPGIGKKLAEQIHEFLLIQKQKKRNNGK